MPFSPERSKTQSDYVRERKEAIEKREYIARIETELAELKASLPKIKADAVREAIRYFETKIDKNHIDIHELEEYANKLEAGE